MTNNLGRLEYTAGLFYAKLLLLYQFEDMGGSRSTFLENSTHYYGNRSEIISNYTGYCEEFLVYYHHRTILYAFVFGPMISLGLIGNVIYFFTLAKLTHRNGVTFQLRVLAIIDFCLLRCLAFAVFTDKTASTQTYETKPLPELMLTYCHSIP